MKTERTQIHLLSDALVAVAPLDLKVPHISNNASLVAMKVDKLLVTDKITTSSKKFVSHVYQTPQTARMNFEKLLS